MNRPVGLQRPASVAALPSRTWPHENEPLPATVVMTPVAGAPRRIRWFVWSAMKTLPAESNATLDGFCSIARVAAPPSPANPAVVPATVVMTPVAPSTRRIRAFDRSAMRRSPFEPFTATPYGLLRSVKSLGETPMRSKSTKLEPAGVVRVKDEVGGVAVL